MEGKEVSGRERTLLVNAKKAPGSVHLEFVSRGACLTLLSFSICLLTDTPNSFVSNKTSQDRTCSVQAVTSLVSRERIGRKERLLSLDV